MATPFSLSSALLIFSPVILFYLFSISTARPTTPVTAPSAITATVTATISSSPATPTNTSPVATNPTSCSFTTDPGCWWSSTAGIVAIVGIVVSTIVGILGVAIAAITLHGNRRTRREDEARRVAAEQEKERKNRTNPLKSAFWKRFWRK